jgi:hypothetical protein
LQQERDRKSSLEERGIALITAAGTVVTLAFAVATFAKGGNGLPNLSVVAKVFLIAALIAYMVTGVYGVLVNRRALYAEAENVTLTSLTAQNHWGWSDVTGAARRVAELKVSMIKVGRQRDGVKADYLRYSIISLFIAAGFLAAAVVTVVVYK